MMKSDCKRTQMNNIFCFGLKHSIKMEGDDEYD